MKESRIIEKNIYCRIKNSIIKLFRWYINLINPVRILRYYKREFKEHKITYAGILIALVLFTGLRVGRMDFNIWDLLLNIPDAAFAGGADLFNSLKVDTTSGFMEDVAHPIYDLMEPIGISLLIMYWLIGLARIIPKRDFDTFQLFKYFVKLIIPATFIFNGWEIIKLVVDLGNAILDLLAPSFTVPNPVVENPKEKMDIIKLVIHFYPIFFMFAIGLVTQVSAKLAVFGRYIKMAVYLGFLPIHLADFVTEEHSYATRALKQAIAFSLQGAVILAINFAAYKLIRSMLDSEFAADISIVRVMWEGGYNLFTLVAIMGVSLTAVGLYSQSEAIAKSIVGI